MSPIFKRHCRLTILYVTVGDLLKAFLTNRGQYITNRTAAHWAVLCCFLLLQTGLSRVPRAWLDQPCRRTEASLTSRSPVQGGAYGGSESGNYKNKVHGGKTDRKWEGQRGKSSPGWKKNTIVLIFLVKHAMT